MYDLTGFKRDSSTAAGGLDGSRELAIKDEVQKYYKTGIRHGRLYPNLDTLVERGLVERGEIDRRTNYQTVTRRGHREITARPEWEAKCVGA